MELSEGCYGNVVGVLIRLIAIVPGILTYTIPVSTMYMGLLCASPAGKASYTYSTKNAHPPPREHRVQTDSQLF